MDKVSIAVVDDHSMFREGLIGLIKYYTNFQVIFEASNGIELLEKLKVAKPNIIILDIEMPVMNGLDAAMEIKKNYPDIKILILTMHNEEEYIVNLIENGVHGFLLKDNSSHMLIEAITSLVERGNYFTSAVSVAMVNKIKADKKATEAPALTVRETEVVKLICKQHTNAEISEILNVGQRTVESHRQAILNKTGAKNTVGIVLYAIQNKIIEKRQGLSPGY